MIVKMMMACKLLPILERALMIELEREAAEELRLMTPLLASHLVGLLGCMTASLCYRNALRALLLVRH
jgi:hypothetical protein